MTPLHLDDLSAQRYLEAQLPGPERLHAGRHLESCEACRALVDSYRALAEALDDLDAALPPADFTAQVLERVEARERRVARERGLAAGILGLVAAAAVALLAWAGPGALAPAFSSLGDLLGRSATGLRIAADVVEPLVRALRLEIALVCAAAVLTLLAVVRHLSPGRAEALA
jgi:anti-sigma factor RsiW